MTTTDITTHTDTAAPGEAVTQELALVDLDGPTRRLRALSVRDGASPHAQAVTPSGTVEAPSSVAATLRRLAGFPLLACVVAVAAVLLRAVHASSAYDVFMDELEYADVANSLAAGHGSQLFDAPFYLHPPLFFLVVAGVVGRAVSHLTVDFVLGLRWVNLPFAAANTLLVIAIARRFAPRWAALVVGLLYACDPFVIKFDGRLMLETSMMTWVLVGLWAIFVALRHSGTRRRSWLIAAGAGFGIALTTKETSALITALPLLLMLVTAWGLRRREAGTVLLAQGSVYTLYLLWVVCIGDFPAWFDQTVAGSFRAVGVVKQTGFNSVGYPSFTDRMIANLGLFAPSYVLIGAASCFAVFLWGRSWRSLHRETTGAHGDAGGDRELSLIITWFAAVLVAIFYTFVFGEVEEQTFYMLAVPSMLVAGVALMSLRGTRTLTRIGVGLLTVVVLAGSLAIWARVHLEPDNSYEKLTAYITSNIPAGTTLALGEATAQFVLPTYDIRTLHDVDDARRTGAKYAVVSTQLSALGLAPATTATVDRLQHDDRLVFKTTGRTNGDLRIYELTPPLPGAGARPSGPVAPPAPPHAHRGH